VPLINPTYASWGLCESFIRYLNDGELQPADEFCGQCSAGWVNPYFVNRYHTLKALSPR